MTLNIEWQGLDTSNKRISITENVRRLSTEFNHYSQNN